MTEMPYRRLGRSGLKVSVLSFGSWVTFGDQVDTALARDCLSAARDAGVNFFDNAEAYAGGQSEQIMGDLKVLWMCGLPGLTPDKMIEVDFEAIEDDPEGVVHIDNADYLSRPVRLGSSEASALIVALRALREGSTHSSHEVIDRCLTKLEEASATGVGPPQVEVHLPRTADAERHSATLRLAVEENRQARLDYYVPTRDETTRRTVDPLAVLTSDGRDYLDAWCHLAQARRLFRLDRLHAVEVVDAPRQEHDLESRDLAAGLFAPGPADVVVVIHLERHARWVADYYPVDAVEELAEGRLQVRLRAGDPRWLVRLVLRLAPAVTVVSPAWLREEVSRAASATLGLYADNLTPAQNNGVA